MPTNKNNTNQKASTTQEPWAARLFERSATTPVTNTVRKFARGGARHCVRVRGIVV